MVISNKKKALYFKKLFFIVSLIIALAVLVLFLLDLIIYAFGAIGIFSIWLLYFLVADFQFIEFKIQDTKVILRYYKAIRFGKAEYNSIEFPKKILYRAYFENSMFGKMTELVLVVRTKRGIAEYPSVSFTAVPKNDRLKIQEALSNILKV